MLGRVETPVSKQSVGAAQQMNACTVHKRELCQRVEALHNELALLLPFLLLSMPFSCAH